MHNIRIVLVETSHPGNIGSAARAMKTMGLHSLYLVNPKSFPDKQAEVMASNATSVLDNAVVTSTLEDALSDCELVFASSARMRYLDWTVLDPKAAMQKACEYAKEHTESQVAVVFGRERTGLTNHELKQSHYHIHIPANPEYSSLNLAQAVQVVSYEARMQFLQLTKAAALTNKPRQIANAKSLELFYQHMEEFLLEIGFINPKAPRQIMNRMRRLYQRTELDADEVNILRGSFEKTLNLKKRLKGLTK